MNKLLKDTRNLAFLGVMLAMTILLDWTPLGAIPLGAVSATIIHIPTIITGIILGPIAGWLMGTAMGLTSLIHAAVKPVTLIDPLFINPLISVVPRMFIGVVSYYAYKAMMSLFRKVNTKQAIGAAVAGVLGSATNTVLVLLALYLLEVKRILVLLNMEKSDFIKLLLGIVTTNGVLEAIVSAIVVSAVSVAYFAYNKTRN